MKAAQVRKARMLLGRLWGLDRPLHAAELGRALGLVGRDPGATVKAWEAGRNPVSGPVAIAIDALLAGHDPAEWPAEVIMEKESGR